MANVTPNISSTRRGLTWPGARENLPNVALQKTNLPAEATLFVGREAELGHLEALLHEHARAITLVGPPGVGKTRLARRFAHLALSRFGRAGAGGAWFCDLTECHTLEQILGAVADALELSSAADPQRVGHALSARGPVLIVLDNLEQVIEPACEALSVWLERAPNAVFLLTSRERLRLPDEVVVELEPLPADHAVQLFVERARRSRPSYTPGAAEREVLSEIAIALECLPLAIELAAARMAVLTPDGIKRRLQKRFELLGNVRRGTNARQATLWGAIEWSWELLTPAEKAALVQCSVFRGGFTIDAAEQVVSLDALPDAPWTVDVVQSLRDKSLLRAWEPLALHGELRFGFYESIREFAQKQLGTDAALQSRHAAFTIEQCAALAERVHGHEGLATRERLALETDNLLAVVRDALDRGDTEVARRGVLALHPVLSTRGPYALHLELLDRALAQRKQGEPAQLARVLFARGSLHRKLGRPDEARRDLEDAMIVARDAGARGAEAEALSELGIVDHEQGRLDEAGLRYEEALGIYRQVGDRRGEGRALGSTAILHQEQGRVDDAQIHYERALTIFRQVGDRYSEAIFLSNLGDLHHQQRRPGEAAVHYVQALGLLREIGDRRIEGVVLGNLGGILQEQGALDQAYERRMEAATVLAEVGDRRLEGIFVGYLGGLRLEQGHPEEAGDHLRHALELMREATDRRFEGVLLSYLGVVEAIRGAPSRSAAAFDAAEQLIGDLDDAFLRCALALHRGHLDLLRVREARAKGKDTTALVERLAQRLRDIDEQPEGESPADASDEVRFALRMLKAAVREHAPEAARTVVEESAERVLLIDTEGRGFEVPGEERVDLGRRRALRLILRKLANHGMTAGGQALSLDDLLEAGWPGERVLPEAGANRVYVAVATLRKLGLRDVLLNRDDGYLLDPDVELQYGDA